MKKTRQISVILTAILFAFFCMNANASINESFTFQGKITDNDGTNLLNADASCVVAGADTCDFKVSLYDSTTGGNLLWQETKQNIEIGDNDGIFNLTLDCAGTFSNCYQGSYTDTIFSDGTDIYIQIEFDPDGDNDYAEGETFSPRREMTAVPYAFHAKTADTATDAGTLDSVDSTSFLRSDTNDTFESGSTLTFAGDLDSNGQVSIADTDISLDGATTNLTATGDFSVNTNNLFIEKSTGEVGIGDVTPSHTLDINGDIGIQGGEIYLTGITSSSSTTEGTIYYDNDDDNLYVYANGGWVDLTTQGGSSLWTDGTNGHFNNTEGIIVGADIVETISNTGFSGNDGIDAGDLFVSGEIGSEGSVYTDGSFISGASLHLSDSAILDTNGDINLQADNDTDDYLYIDTTSNLSTLYWEGQETNDPGIGVDVNGNLVYRDEDESSWATFDSIADFSNGGDTTGVERSFGNNDNYALSFKTKNAERLYIGEGESVDASLLIHSNATDESTTFTDSSDSSHTITARGQVNHETDQPKFGTTGIEFDGSGDYLELADSDDWDFGTGDFTIDFWMYRRGSLSNHGLLMSSGAANPYWHIRVSGTDCLFYVNGGVKGYGQYTEVLYQWEHYAFVRNGNTLTIYVNGTAIGSRNVAGIAINGSDYLWIGNSTSQAPHAYFDEVRIIKGTASWASNFSPPIGPHGNSNGNGIGGNIGINTSSPSARLDVLYNGTEVVGDNTKGFASWNMTGASFNTSAQSLTNYSAYLTNTSTESAGSNDLTNIALYASASGADNNYAAIFENGSVGIGTTTPTNGGLVVTDGVTIGTDSTDNLIDNATNGASSSTLYIGNNTIDTSASDERVKDVIGETNRGLSDILALNVVDFTWKESHSNDNETINTGLIAQEVFRQMPYLAKKPQDEETGLWTVKYNYLSALAIRGIQEQQGMIDSLNNITNDLTSSLTNTETTNQEKFTIIGSNLDQLDSQQAINTTSLETLTTTIENLNDLTTLMTDTLTNHEERIKTLESQISNLNGGEVGIIPENLQALADNLTTELVTDPETGEETFIFDVDGNLRVGRVKTERIEVGEIEAGKMLVEEIVAEKIVTSEEKSGKGVILAGEIFKKINSSKVTKNSMIHITLTSLSHEKDLYVDENEIIEGESFVVKFEGAPLEENVTFNWFFIE